MLYFKFIKLRDRAKFLKIEFDSDVRAEGYLDLFVGN